MSKPWQEWEYQEILCVEDNNFQSKKRVSGYVLKRLLKARGRDIKHCEECGKKGTKKHPVTVHHKDGNCCNNLPENLEVLCPKCHREKEKQQEKTTVFRGENVDGN